MFVWFSPIQQDPDHRSERIQQVSQATSPNRSTYSQEFIILQKSAFIIARKAKYVNYIDKNEKLA
jgi:hypothetical protein